MFHSESIGAYSRYVSTKFQVSPIDTPCPRLWTLLGIAAQTRVYSETWSQHQCTCAHLLYIWTVWGLGKGVWMRETWNLVQTCFEYVSMDSEWNIYSPCTAWPGGGWFEGEEEGRRRTCSLWHHQGRECQNSFWNIEVEYMERVSDSQPIFRVPDPVPRELATLLAPQWNNNLFKHLGRVLDAF